MTRDSLTDRCIVVLGAASGIGAATARALIREGARVTLADVRAEPLHQTVAALESAGRAIAAPVDVTVPETLDRLRDQALEAFGQVDAVVNCAAVIVPGPVDAIALDDVRRQVETNFTGTLLVTRAFLPYFRARGAGHLVHLASLGGIVPLPDEATYCATKFAVRGFCLALGLELAATPISVSVVCPDSTDTAQLRIEAAAHGSAMSFLSPPLEPGQVARAIVQTLRHPQPEVTVPRRRALPARLLAWSPAVLRLVYPLLRRWGRARRQRFHAAVLRRAVEATT